MEFYFTTTSNGVHNVSISGLEDLQGTTLTPDNFSFQTDDVPPVVVSSSIADGAVLSPGPLTEVITFNEPIQPSSVSTSDILLYGEIRGIEYTPSSISFDPTDTILTITYSSLPTDAYQFALEAGPDNFLSDAGVPLQNSFVINFTIPGGTSTITGLQPVLPLGSLVYETTIDGLLISSERRRYLRPGDQSRADPVGDRDARHAGHDGDRHPVLALGHRDRLGDLRQPRRPRHPAGRRRAPRAGPTRSWSPAGLASTRSSPCSTP